jgi:hypothetical protein
MVQSKTPSLIHPARGTRLEREVSYFGMFGTTSHRSKFTNLRTAMGHNGKLLDPFLMEGFSEEGELRGDNKLFDIVEHQANGWVVEQAWGFGLVKNERYFIRKTIVRKMDELVRLRTVSEWKGKTMSG